ncbi:hypothetical protein ACHQM5_023836 [Ranunculus cassubicifolius]
MLDMVDGTSSPPAENITIDDKIVVNPSFLEWKKKDQRLLSWLHRTLTPPIFAQVIGYKTSRSLWEGLHKAYTSQTNARYYQIKNELSNIRKGSSSISDYMDRIRQLTDELSLIEQPMTNRDIIGVVLQGLDLDYDVVVNQVQTMSTVPSIEEIYSMLLNREKRLEVYHTSAHTSTTALLASNNRPNERYNQNNRNNNRGTSPRRGNHRGRGGRGSGRGSSYHYQQNPIPVCQLCDKPGHYARTCRSYSISLSQQDDLPTAFSAMNMSHAPYDPTWFPDTGATHHMTADDSMFLNRQDYTGTDQVTVANGTSLPITGTGQNSSSRTK